MAAPTAQQQTHTWASNSPTLAIASEVIFCATKDQIHIGARCSESCSPGARSGLSGNLREQQVNRQFQTMVVLNRCVKDATF